MDMTNLIVPGGSAAFGVKEAALTEEDKTTTETTNNYSKISDIVNGFYSGKNTLADIVTASQTQMPIIPICFRNGLLFHSEDISGDITAVVSDVFFSIAEFRKNN